MRAVIQSVPTNIITGFLGAGKTSTILHLLKSKPEHERWAVLVNEFGEIGIDGALFQGRYSENNGVYIREVPGGCMCCTAGLPMQVVLAQLLRLAKPDRLLIEPTGLGHPIEVLQTLNNRDFRDVLSIQRVLTLVDARQLIDRRYAEHETFQQQIAIADVIVANKCDLYGDDDKTALKAYLRQHFLLDMPLVFTEQGAIEPTLLDGPRSSNKSTFRGSISSLEIVANAANDNQQELNQSIPDCGFIKALNEGEGFVSVGWRFSHSFKFDKNALYAFLCGITAERLKATFITTKGCFSYNLTKDAITEVPFEIFDESRIEIIAAEINASWEAELFNCIS